MGNSTVSCSGEENALMHHDHNLFLCCHGTFLNPHLVQRPFSCWMSHSHGSGYISGPRGPTWETLAAFVQHLSHRIQIYCKQPCILRQRTLSLSANPQLGVWLPVTLMNVKKDSPRGGWELCHWAMSHGAGRQLSLLPQCTTRQADTSVVSCGWGQTH